MEVFFTIVFIVMFVATAAFIIFGFMTVFNPNMRSKWVGRQLQIHKKVLEDNKETIKDINSLGGEVAVDSINDILDKKGDDMKKAADRSAELSKDSIKTVTRSIKEGLKDEIYCKHCGDAIDADSKFCKNCGKRV